MGSRQAISCCGWKVRFDFNSHDYDWQRSLDQRLTQGISRARYSITRQHDVSNVRACRAPNEHQPWAMEYDRIIRDVLSLQGEIERAVADEIYVKLRPEVRTRAFGNLIWPRRGRLNWPHQRTQQSLPLRARALVPHIVN
jgi:hypothetical protein